MLPYGPFDQMLFERHLYHPDLIVLLHKLEWLIKLDFLTHKWLQKQFLHLQNQILALKMLLEYLFGKQSHQYRLAPLQLKLLV